MPWPWNWKSRWPLGWWLGCKMLGSVPVSPCQAAGGRWHMSCDGAPRACAWGQADSRLEPSAGKALVCSASCCTSHHGAHDQGKVFRSLTSPQMALDAEYKESSVAAEEKLTSRVSTSEAELGRQGPGPPTPHPLPFKHQPLSQEDWRCLRDKSFPWSLCLEGSASLR